MRQVKINDKTRYRSSKEISITLGKNDSITITFHRYAWQVFTKSEIIRIWAQNGRLHFGEPDCNNLGLVYKLTKPHPDTHPETRSIQLAKSRARDIFKVIDSLCGDSNHCEFDIGEYFGGVVEIAPIVRASIPDNYVVNTTASTTPNHFIFRLPKETRIGVLSAMSKDELIDLFEEVFANATR